MSDGAAIVEAGGAGLAPSALERACVLLAEARSVDDVLELRDQAEAMRAYLERRDSASKAYADAYEIVQRANRRIGELLRELPQSKAGRKPAAAADGESFSEENKSKVEQLRDFGIPTKQAYELEKLADLPEPEFEARVDVQRQRLERGAPVRPITAHTSASDHDGNTYGTPGDYMDAARIVLGSIELDPATNPIAQQRVGAERFYTEADNGLEQPWVAKTLWLNPPYSSPLVDKFCGRFADAYEAGDVGAGLVLVNACTETIWFQRLLGMCAVCFPDKRIAFLDADGNPVKGNSYRQAVFYAGRKLPLFAKTFGQFGRVLVEYGGRAAR